MQYKQFTEIILKTKHEYLYNIFGNKSKDVCEILDSFSSTTSQFELELSITDCKNIYGKHTSDIYKTKQLFSSENCINKQIDIIISYEQPVEIKGYKLQKYLLSNSVERKYRIFKSFTENGTCVTIRLSKEEQLDTVSTDLNVLNVELKYRESFISNDITNWRIDKTYRKFLDNVEYTNIDISNDKYVNCLTTNYDCFDYEIEYIGNPSDIWSSILKLFSIVTGISYYKLLANKIIDTIYGIDLSIIPNVSSIYKTSDDYTIHIKLPDDYKTIDKVLILDSNHKRSVINITDGTIIQNQLFTSNIFKLFEKYLFKTDIVDIYLYEVCDNMIIDCLIYCSKNLNELKYVNRISKTCDVYTKPEIINSSIESISKLNSNYISICNSQQFTKSYKLLHTNKNVEFSFLVRYENNSRCFYLFAISDNIENLNKSVITDDKIEKYFGYSILATKLKNYLIPVVSQYTSITNKIKYIGNNSINSELFENISKYDNSISNFVYDKNNKYWKFVNISNKVVPDNYENVIEYIINSEFEPPIIMKSPKQKRVLKKNEEVLNIIEQYVLSIIKNFDTAILISKNKRNVNYNNWLFRATKLSKIYILVSNSQHSNISKIVNSFYPKCTQSFSYSLPINNEKLLDLHCIHNLNELYNFDNFINKSIDCIYVDDLKTWNIDEMKQFIQIVSKILKDDGAIYIKLEYSKKLTKKQFIKLFLNTQEIHSSDINIIENTTPPAILCKKIVSSINHLPNWFNNKYCVPLEFTNIFQNYETNINMRSSTPTDIPIQILLQLFEQSGIFEIVNENLSTNVELLKRINKQLHKQLDKFHLIQISKKLENF